MSNKTDTQELEVSRISQADWNPNEMSNDKFEALKKDLKENGQLYPIIVRLIKGNIPKKFPKDPNDAGLYIEDRYEVVEGNHRLKAFRELGLKKILVHVQEFKDPTDAMLLNFRANQERGQHNPFKEAELFKLLLAGGRTQEDLAKALGIDRTTIAKRISLLKIDDKVRADILKVVPHITVSQFEILSPTDVQVQRAVAVNLRGDVEEGTITVSRFKFIVQRQAEKVKAFNMLQDALKNTKYTFRKCPQCGKSPEDISHYKLPFVECVNYHHWSLLTGKDPSTADRTRASASSSSHKSTKPEVPNYVRTVHTQQEFAEAYSNYVKSVIPGIDHISQLRLTGKKGGKDVDLSINTGGLVSYFSADTGSQDDTDFSIEEKKYASEELKKFKSTIWAGGFVKSQAQLDKVEKEAEAFLQKYGGSPGSKSKVKT